MNHFRLPLVLTLLVLVMPLSAGAQLYEEPKEQPKDTPKVDKAKPAKTYTAHNLWYEKPENISSINYATGTMIPAGTELSSIKVVGGLGRKPFIKLTTKEGGEEFRIYFKIKFHPGVTAKEFMKRMITDKPFEQLTKGLSAKEIEAIKEGRLVVGMSKEAVIMTRGYPPEHKTSSVKNDKWLFWENRFRKKAIHFDKEGRTIRPPDPRESDDL